MRSIGQFIKSNNILSHSLKSLLIKLFSMVLTLLVSVVLARTLTVQGYGQYTYAFSIISILIIPTSLGLPNLIVKYIAEYSINKEFSLMKGLIVFAIRFVVLSSIVLSIVSYIIAISLNENVPVLDLETFSFALLLLPTLALNSIVGAAIRGKGRVIIGQISHSIIYPLVFIVILLIYTNKFDQVLSPYTAMLIHAISISSAVLVNFVLIRYIFSKKVKEAKAEFQYKKWFATALPLFITSGLLIISSKVDILMLGIMTNQENVGIYSIATRGATVLGFAIQSVNAIMAPKYSALYACRNMTEIQKNYSLSSIIIIVITLPLALILVIFSKEILMVVYGERYISGAFALSVLCIGQAINAFSGTNGTLLNMTGYEKISAYGVILSTIVNITMNMILIPSKGMEGAAIASVVSFVVWNLMLSIVIYIKLNIIPLPFFIREKR